MQCLNILNLLKIGSRPTKSTMETEFPWLYCGDDRSVHGGQQQSNTKPRILTMQAFKEPYSSRTSASGIKSRSATVRAVSDEYQINEASDEPRLQHKASASENKPRFASIRAVSTESQSDRASDKTTLRHKCSIALDGSQCTGSIYGSSPPESPQSTDSDELVPELQSQEEISYTDSFYVKQALMYLIPIPGDAAHAAGRRESRQSSSNPMLDAQTISDWHRLQRDGRSMPSYDGSDLPRVVRVSDTVVHLHKLRQDPFCATCTKVSRVSSAGFPPGSPDPFVQPVAARWQRPRGVSHEEIPSIAICPTWDCVEAEVDGDWLTTRELALNDTPPSSKNGSRATSCVPPFTETRDILNASTAPRWTGESPIGGNEDIFSRPEWYKHPWEF